MPRINNHEGKTAKKYNLHLWEEDVELIAASVEGKGISRNMILRKIVELYANGIRRKMGIEEKFGERRVQQKESDDE